MCIRDRCIEGDFAKKFGRYSGSCFPTVKVYFEFCRAAALEKARSMTNHIAYPDELLDNNKLNEFYEGVSIESRTGGRKRREILIWGPGPGTPLTPALL